MNPPNPAPTPPWRAGPERSRTGQESRLFRNHEADEEPEEDSSADSVLSAAEGSTPIFADFPSLSSVPFLSTFSSFCSPGRTSVRKGNNDEEHEGKNPCLSC
jgi:hypothetical protein